MRPDNDGAQRALERFCAPEGTAERVLIVGAHPDDETIGAGARLAVLPGATILCLTNGSPRNTADAMALGFAGAEEYEVARRREWWASLALVGVAPERARQLPFDDQDASYRFFEVTAAVEMALLSLAPAIVVTHPYEGGHPDHDAAAFAVYHACRLLGDAAPVVLEFASYHAVDGKLRTGHFLPQASSPERVLTLRPEERERKQRQLAEFASQRKVLAAFGVETERFRVAPRYDFLEAPHPGKLYYETQSWGSLGTEWRARAKAALPALGA